MSSRNTLPDVLPAPPENEVLDALVAELYSRGRISMLFLVPVLLVLRTFLASAWQGSAALRTFFLTAVGIAMARGAVCWTFRTGATRARRAVFAVSTVLLGASLGGIVLSAYPHLDALGVALLAVCLAGINSIAVVSMALCTPAYFAYVFLSLGTLGAAALRWPHPELGPLFAALIFLYVIALSATSVHVHATRRKLIEMQLRFRDLSQRDSLTRLHNRRFVSDYMDRRTGGFVSARPTAASRRVLGAMVVDIDHFKRVNDRFGHDAGDAVLRQFAVLLQASVRSTDIVLRWGGEEFVILSADADQQALREIADRIRERAEQRVFPLPSGPTARITCSIGYTAAEIPLDGPGAVRWEDAVGLADRALAHAKETGRNRAVGLFVRGRIHATLAHVLRAMSDAGVEAAVQAGLVETAISAGDAETQPSEQSRRTVAAA